MVDLDDFETGPGGKAVADYNSYEDFLGDFVQQLDRVFLEDIRVCRNIVELGHRGSRDGYSKAWFDNMRKKIDERKRATQAKTNTVLSFGYDFTEPHLRALQQREEGNRNGKLASVIFIRMLSPTARAGGEISGYIDYSHRLCSEDFTPVFNKKTLLTPQETDLSFYDWESLKRKGQNSPNYEVINTKKSMSLRNLRDGKIMYVGSGCSQVGENSSRTTVATDAYRSMIIFDHYNRRSV